MRIVTDDRIRQALPWLGKASYMALMGGFLMTDIFFLRCLLAGGYAGLTSYHLFQMRPLRIPLVGSCLFLMVNGGMALLVFQDRYLLLSSDEESIYSEHFEGTMSARDFSTLMAHGETLLADSPTEVVKSGTVADLMIILDGSAEVRFDRTRFVTIGPGGLVGEIGFVSGSPASATVTVSRGSRYVRWRRDGLLKALADEPSLQKSLELLIGRELMRKLAQNSWYDDALKKELSPLPRARTFGWFE